MVSPQAEMGSSQTAGLRRFGGRRPQGGCRSAASVGACRLCAVGVRQIQWGCASAVVFLRGRLPQWVVTAVGFPQIWGFSRQLWASTSVGDMLGQIRTFWCCGWRFRLSQAVVGGSSWLFCFVSFYVVLF